MQLSYETSVERNGSTVIVLVYGTYIRGYKGARDSLNGKRDAGPALEPDEPPHVEIDRALNAETGEPFMLTGDEVEKISDLMIENVRLDGDV